MNTSAGRPPRGPARRRIVGAIALPLLLLSGLAIHLGHLRSDNLFSLTHAGHLFAFHSMLGTAALSLPLVAFALLAAPPPPSALLRTLAVATAALALYPDALGRFAPLVHVFAGAFALSAAMKRDREHGPTALGLTLAVGGASTIGLGVALIVTQGAPPVGHAFLDIVLAVAVAAIAEPSANRPAPWWLRILLAASALGWIPQVARLAGYWSTSFVGLILLLLFWLVVLFEVLERVWREDTPLFARAVMCLAFVVHVEASILRWLLDRARDVSVHDTLVETVVLHTEGAAVAFVLLGLWLRTLEIPRAGAGIRAVALGAVTVGFHAWLWSQLAFARGMPRRYFAYLPQLEAGHITLALCAVAFCAALTWFLLRLLRLEPKPPTSLPQRD